MALIYDVRCRVCEGEHSDQLHAINLKTAAKLEAQWNLRLEQCNASSGLKFAALKAKAFKKNGVKLTLRPENRLLQLYIGNTVEVGKKPRVEISWGTPGTVPIKEAMEFADTLRQAAQFAQELEILLILHGQEVL